MFHKKVCIGYKKVPQAVLVNFGFILREKSKFSISCALVLNTCAAESYHFEHHKNLDISVLVFHFFFFY